MTGKVAKHYNCLNEFKGKVLQLAYKMIKIKGRSLIVTNSNHSSLSSVSV